MNDNLPTMSDAFGNAFSATHTLFLAVMADPVEAAKYAATLGTMAEGLYMALQEIKRVKEKS